MHVHIAKIDGILWSGKADSVTAPGSEGEVTILKGHVPLVTRVQPGTLVVKVKGAPVFTYTLQRGVLEVTASSVTILS